MKAKPGQYVGAKFSKEQLKARAMWQCALALEITLAQAMRISADGRSREDWHQWLDRRLDGIERIRSDAKGLFFEVEESFVIASFE